MKKLLLLSFTAAVFVFGFQQKSETYSPTQAVTETELREASARALKLIQHAQDGWYKKETCASCHNQLLPEIPLRLARERGVAADEKQAREATETTFASLKDLDAAAQGYDYIDAYFNAWTLIAAHAAGIKPSLTTSAYAQLVASYQRADGHWDTIDVRPPQAYGPIAATAACAQAVRLYLPEQLKDEKASRLRRAQVWLLKAQPRTTEESASQLLGLRWTGADAAACQKAARRLLGEQREDGGWSQLAGMTSDAYSTGDALVALREGAGLATSDPAYQRGLRFLLKTQAADGSWHVTSRLHPPAPVSPPYFESGFPYGHDQFVSIMASSWAAAALLEALPAPAGASAKAREMADLSPAEGADWIKAALNGTAADLKRQLDAGMNPNSKTAEGTTALMLAARDLAKVRLLVARGADVNARAATGVTPLMAAAQYYGNAEVIRFLLEQGAKPTAAPGVEVRNDASALFYATMAGDVEMMKALVDAGASLSDRMKLIGRFSNSLLLYAVSSCNTPVVEYLLDRGGNPNEKDDDQISLLAWAAISNRPDTVRALLAHGAQVNSVDKNGMTPLLYAASINFGDTDVLDRLIAGGADLKAANKQGQTAADLTRMYNHTALAGRLTARAAAR